MQLKSLSLSILLQRDKEMSEILKKKKSEDARKELTGYVYHSHSEEARPWAYLFNMTSSEVDEKFHCMRLNLIARHGY